MIPSVARLLLLSHGAVTTVTLAVRHRLIVACRNEFFILWQRRRSLPTRNCNTTATVRMMHNCACDARLLAVSSPVAVPMCLCHWLQRLTVPWRYYLVTSCCCNAAATLPWCCQQFITMPVLLTVNICNTATALTHCCHRLRQCAYAACFVTLPLIVWIILVHPAIPLPMHDNAVNSGLSLPVPLHGGLIVE